MIKYSVYARRGVVEDWNPNGKTPVGTIKFQNHPDDASIVAAMVEEKIAAPNLAAEMTLHGYGDDDFEVLDRQGHPMFEIVRDWTGDETC